EESTYAVIPLSEQKIAHDETLSKSTATDLSNTIAKIQTTHQQRSQTVLPFPEITKLHQETLLESNELFRQ
ncbi:NADH oxidase, partial [Staphylococcus sp. SIMBA_130]